MTNDDLICGQAAVRKMIDASGYGGFVSDDQCKAFAFTVIEAVDKQRAERASASAPEPVSPPIVLPAPPRAYSDPWGQFSNFLKGFNK